jgi:hypothetical protein
MNLIAHLKRPPWRTVLLLLAILALIGLVYLIWSPGQRLRDGRHDLRSNGIWIQHGWLGDDRWFKENQRDPSKFRDPRRIQELAEQLSAHGIRHVFPHLCPCDFQGKIAAVEGAQTERFLDAFEQFKVLPWVGGVLDAPCAPQSPKWRAAFIASVVDLLRSHPRLAGVHINIEPMPSRNADFLVLLRELRQAIPPGKLISVAAYPPPTRWHPFPDVHWDEGYFRQVSQHADQLAVMMYDTSIRWQKVYQYVMRKWTGEILEWGRDSEVLLGVPAYEDAGVGYHDPGVENLENALLGIHAGLSRFPSLPKNYRGIAIYCEWEMNDAKWERVRTDFEKAP